MLATLLLTPSIHRGKEFDWHFYRFLWQSAEARPGATLFVLQSAAGPYRVWELEGHVYRHPRVQPLAYPAGASLDALVPPGTPTGDILVVTRAANPPPLAGGQRYELVYEAEPGTGRRRARWGSS